MKRIGVLILLLAFGILCFAGGFFFSNYISNAENNHDIASLQKKPEWANKSKTNSHGDKTSQNKTNDIIQPKMNFFEETMQSVLGDIVFVTKNIYGGDLSYSCILKGTVRNISNKPYKNVYIIWTIWGVDNKLFNVTHYHEISGDYESRDTVYKFKIDYLDSKSEVDFSMSIPLHDELSIYHANLIRNAIFSDRWEVGIYIPKE